MPVIIRGRRVMFLPSRPGDGPQPLKRPPCSYCGKPGHAFAPTWGSHLGSSGVLAANGGGRYVVFAGGLHCWSGDPDVDGVVVGGVGVSGGTAEEDAACAEAALVVFVDESGGTR